jgi:Flp pilus assembly pilin Flp
MNKSSFLANRRGAAGLEYALLIALLCLISLGSIEMFSGKLSESFYDLVAAMSASAVDEIDVGQPDG